MYQLVGSNLVLVSRKEANMNSPIPGIDSIQKVTSYENIEYIKRNDKLVNFPSGGSSGIGTKEDRDDER